MSSLFLAGGRCSGNGGGEDVMLDDIFGASPKPDKYLGNAGYRRHSFMEFS